MILSVCILHTPNLKYNYTDEGIDSVLLIDLLYHTHVFASIILKPKIRIKYGLRNIFVLLKY